MAAGADQGTGDADPAVPRDRRRDDGVDDAAGSAAASALRLMYISEKTAMSDPACSAARLTPC
jgi:hypothetical protein